MLPDQLPPFILASRSPRRRALLLEAGLRFEVVDPGAEEVYPPHLDPQQVVAHLARLKLEACSSWLKDHLVLTADTLVFSKTQILGKPADASEARQMLAALSGSTHRVTTSVCLGYRQQRHQLSVTTEVEFARLEQEEIDHYIDTCKPYDKAGSYGIQEWIGLVGIRRISGSYTNVVGLPVHETYRALQACTAGWLKE